MSSHAHIEYLDDNPYLSFSLFKERAVRHLSMLKRPKFDQEEVLGADGPYPYSKISRQESAFLKQVAHLPPVGWVKQDHKAHIVVVEHPGEQTEPADAMITTTQNLSLMILHADCQALLMYDPCEHLIAVAHVGWRGSRANMLEALVHKLKTEFQVRPENLLVAISPSLGPDYAYYPEYKQHFPKAMWDYQVNPGYFDFWRLSTDQLMATGVLAKHIQNAFMCTYTNHELCFSYRREGQAAGRHATAITLV